MGRRTVEEKTALEVRKLIEPGLHFVGGASGLAVRVAEQTAKRAPPSATNASRVIKSWILRTTFAGKRVDIGLGSLNKITLAVARERAFAMHAQIANGTNPVAQRRADRAKAAAESASMLTFEEAAKRFINAKAAEWKSPKHRQQWQNTIASYCKPLLGMSVRDIEQEHVLQVLEPEWQKKNETLTRVRGRIENILDYCMQRGYRPRGDNPARWRGQLDKVLANPQKVQKLTATHHAALPYGEIGQFISDLRALHGTSARCLEFVILTACRTGEAIGAQWSEFDAECKVWTVPVSRMKGGREHRIPLSPRAQEIVRALRKQSATEENAENDFVFRGAVKGKGLSNMALLELLKRMKRTEITVHGFRSTFRDWAADVAHAPREVAESCLAHAIGNATEAAYLRSDQFIARRQLMNRWSDFCSKVRLAATGNVEINVIKFASPAA